MAKYFELQQSNGNRTTVTLVVNPIVENGSIRATKVGKLSEFSDDVECKFIQYEPADIIAIGNVICTEIKKTFAE